MSLAWLGAPLGWMFEFSNFQGRRGASSPPPPTARIASLQFWVARPFLRRGCPIIVPHKTGTWTAAAQPSQRPSCRAGVAPEAGSLSFQTSSGRRGMHSTPRLRAHLGT